MDSLLTAIPDLGTWAAYGDFVGRVAAWDLSHRVRPYVRLDKEDGQYVWAPIRDCVWIEEPKEKSSKGS